MHARLMNEAHAQDTLEPRVARAEGGYSRLVPLQIQMVAGLFFFDPLIPRITKLCCSFLCFATGSSQWQRGA